MGKLSTLNSFLRLFKLELRKYNLVNNESLRRSSYFNNENIDLLIDVGANIGSYGAELRRMGYSGMIISFEPLSKPFSELQRISKSDDKWRAFNVAIGANEGTMEINVAGNVNSSSILDMNIEHTNAAPESHYVGKENIKVETLDNFFKSTLKEYKRVYLKIDTQGYESFVLEGANTVLPYIDYIQLELSLKPLYKGQFLFDDLYRILVMKGYSMISIERGFSNPNTGELLQVDALFKRLS